MAKPKQKTFNVGFHVEYLDLSVDITAESMEEALAIARAMKPHEVLESTNYNDYGKVEPNSIFA